MRCHRLLVFLVLTVCLADHHDDHGHGMKHKMDHGHGMKHKMDHGHGMKHKMDHGHSHKHEMNHGHGNQHKMNSGHDSNEHKMNSGHAHHHNMNNGHNNHQKTTTNTHNHGGHKKKPVFKYAHHHKDGAGGKCERTHDQCTVFVGVDKPFVPHVAPCSYVHLISPETKKPGCNIGVDYGTSIINAWVKTKHCEGRYHIQFIHGICEDLWLDANDKAHSKKTLKQPCSNGNICSMTVAKNLGHVPCTVGMNFFFHEKHAWVDQGCKAKFQVCELASPSAHGHHGHHGHH